jgi:hypothetical protein
MSKATGRIILAASYAFAVLFLLIAGLVYPGVAEWSYWAAGACLAHGCLSMGIACAGAHTVAKIAAMTWLSLSNVACVSLLLVHELTSERSWLLATVALGFVTLLLALVVILAFRPVATPPASGDAATR